MPRGRKPKNIPADILTIEFLITREFKNSAEFSKHIIQMAEKRNLSHFECLMEYCQEKDIEPSAVASMLSKPLKALLETEARSRHLLKPDASD